MFDPVFADIPTLLLGALTGLIFGFLLQKGGVAEYQVILGQFLLKDFTMLKVMMSAVVVGGAGVYGMLQLGWIEGLHVKGAVLLANALGGAIFGVGMAVLGYCPGTGVAAVGAGSRHAIFGVFGMLLGAAAFAELYPLISDTLLKVGDLGKVTFVTATGASPWWFIGGLAVLAAAGFYVLERWEAGRIHRPGGSEPPVRSIKLTGQPKATH